MNRWSPHIDSNGVTTEAGIPTAAYVGHPGGRTFKGVITAVNVYDSTSDLDVLAGSPAFNAVYVNVLTYGSHTRLYRNVLWTSERQGLHEGSIKLPRAARIDIGGDLNPNTANPANLDGDHVIIGFLENDWSQPYVLRSIPHPSSDIGNSDEIIGHRMRVKESDGTPNLQKHNGGFWGIDGTGNFWIDLTKSHAGTYKSDGSEPDAPEDGNSGNVTVKSQPGSTLTIQMGTNTITLTESDGKLVITNSGDTELNTSGNVKLGSGASQPLVYGNTYSADISTALAQAITGWTAILTLVQGMAQAYQNLPVFTAFAPAAAVLMNAVTAPVTTVIAQLTAVQANIPNHLSPTVTTK